MTLLFNYNIRKLNKSFDGNWDCNDFKAFKCEDPLVRHQNVIIPKLLRGPKPPLLYSNIVFTLKIIS